MDSILANIDLWNLVLIFGMAAVAFTISTISGGGGALIQVPVLNYLIGVSGTAPVLNLGTFISRPSRLVLFWNYIDWSVTAYYAPAAIAGAWFSSWLFAEVNADWLQIFIGIFLISTFFQFRFGKKKHSFAMRKWFFLPLGLLISVVGTIVGAVGPILNPFYLNLGLSKEHLIGTKTANSFLVGLSQISGYAFFGHLHGKLWVYGITLGLGATLGNIIGKRFLSKMKDESFRKVLILFMVISGILMLYRHFSI